MPSTQRLSGAEFSSYILTNGGYLATSAPFRLRNLPYDLIILQAREGFDPVS